MNYLRKIGRNIHLWRVHICAGRGRWVECSYGRSSGHQHHPIRRNPSGPGIATVGRAADGDTATANRNSSRFRTAPNSCCCFRCFRCRCSEDRRRCKWFVCNLKDQTQKHWSRRKLSQSLDFFHIWQLAPPIARIGNYVSGTDWKKAKKTHRWHPNGSDGHIWRRVLKLRRRWPVRIRAVRCAGVPDTCGWASGYRGPWAEGSRWAGPALQPDKMAAMLGPTLALCSARKRNFVIVAIEGETLWKSQLP